MKKEKGFLKKLTYGDFIRGAELSISNAKNLIMMAQLVSKNGQYGIALGILVLSAEEAVKAYMCKAAGMSKDAKKKDELEKFFESHKVKLKTGHSLNLMLELMDLTTAKFMSIYTSRKTHSLSEHKKLFDEAQQEAFAYAEKEWESFNKKFKKKETFWMSADKEKKQRGFYVSWDGINHAWQSPSDVSQKEFEDDLTIVQKLIDLLEEQISFAGTFAGGGAK